MSIIEELEGLITSKIDAAKTLFSLTKLEAKLAALSIFPLILTLYTLFIILITAWLSAMVLGVYVIVWLGGNLMIALSSIFLLNLILLGLLLKYLFFNIKNMSFEKTRQYLSNAPLFGGPHDPRLDKPTSEKTRSLRKSVKKSTRRSKQS